MGIIQDISQKIDQIIQASSSAYVYTEQCSRITKVLNEVRDKVSKLQSSDSNAKELNSILDQLNGLHNVISGFTSDSWLENCISTPITKPISAINETMNSITELLQKIGISLQNEYVVVTESVANDFVSLYGILADPSRLDDSKVKKKLTEIEKYLTNIGQPLINPVQKKTKGKHKHHHHKKDKGHRKESDAEPKPEAQIELNEHTEVDSSTSLDEQEFNFDNIQKYKLKNTDFEVNSGVLTATDRYTTYSGKMKTTNEDVTIMYLNEDTNTEEKFRRFVSVLTALQHPNLESFVGAVESPLPYIVVTRRAGEKLSDILKRANKSKSQKKSVKKSNEENAEADYIDDGHVRLKEGYKTIIAFNIATAMAYLHSNNIIHRDLCSANVTVDKTLNPRVINFANSRFLPEDASVMSYQPNSSAKFRAPEITDTEDYDESIDVFAFSGLLYELMTGSPPFGERIKMAALEEKIKNAERPLLPENVSPDMKQLIESCWAQDPKSRPSFTDVIDLMLSKKITFPEDEKSDTVEDFYASKSIKNTDMNACLELFKMIAQDISSCFAYLKEAIRVRTLLHGYQFLLQTSSYATENNENDSNVKTVLSNLRSSLEDLHSTLLQTEAEKWSDIALSCSAIEIPTKIHCYMEQIYISMVELGFNVTKYDYVNGDLVKDFRDVYMIFSEYADTYPQAVTRMEEIESFLQERGLEVTITQNEIDERIKQLFTQFKDYKLNRDDFKIIGRPIGTGMSAIVYKAKQLSTDKDVAIKEFRVEYLEDEDTSSLLRREVSSLVKLHNEYLVTFIGFNNDPGKPLWVVSEMVKNGELFNAVKRKKLTPFQKTKVAFEIAEGMEYLHSKRVIHRDLKTGNVLLDGDTPKITDFGYARTNLSLVMTSKVGTINYMAPEVIEGGCYDFKADVFSYAMMLWELYSGTFPFSWVSRARVADEILADSQLPYKMPISPDLKQLIEDGKSFDPNKRPTFTEIIERMIQNNITYNGANPNEVENFYKMKAEKRANKKEGQE